MSDATDDLPSQAQLDANSIPADRHLLVVYEPRVVIPANYRPAIRLAPRFARIIGTGAGVGFVFGVVIALGLPGHGASYRAAVALLVGLGLGMVGALTAGAIATRSRAREPWAPAQAWIPPEPPGPLQDRSLTWPDVLKNKDG